MKYYIKRNRVNCSQFSLITINAVCYSHKLSDEQDRITDSYRERLGRNVIAPFNRFEPDYKYEFDYDYEILSLKIFHVYTNSLSASVWHNRHISKTTVELIK